ncbi:Serine/threonine-protein kinase Nek4 [Plecturocebus cupreus]
MTLAINGPILSVSMSFQLTGCRGPQPCLTYPPVSNSSVKPSVFALPPKVKCSDTITAHCSLKLLGSSNSPASASSVARITDSTVMQSQLAATSAFQAQLILLPQPPKPGDSRQRRHTGRQRDSLVGEAVLPRPSPALPVRSIRDGRARAGPIPTRKTAIGSTED